MCVWGGGGERGGGRLASSHPAKDISVSAVTFGALVTCVCECVVCVSPFCCTTVGLLPSLSSWESDLCCV